MGNGGGAQSVDGSQISGIWHEVIDQYRYDRTGVGDFCDGLKHVHGNGPVRAG